MCGGGPDIDTTYQDFAIQEAARAREEEERRQKRIDEGLGLIRAVFEGGEAAGPGEYRDITEVVNIPEVPGTTLTAAQQIQLDNARKKQRQEGGPLRQWYQGPLPSDPTPARSEEVTRRDYVPGEVQTFDGTQPILDQRRTAMEGFYLPQIDKQFGNAKDDLTFALHRAGLLSSTAAGQKQGDLSEMFSLERAGVLADIDRDISSTQGQLSQNRSAIEAALRSSADAAGATDQALSAMTTFRQDMPQLQTLPSLFAGAATGIGAASRGYDTGQITGTKAKIPNPFASKAGRVVGA